MTVFYKKCPQFHTNCITAVRLFGLGSFDHHEQGLVFLIAFPAQIQMMENQGFQALAVFFRQVGFSVLIDQFKDLIAGKFVFTRFFKPAD